MSGILIYTNKEARRNRFAVDKFTKNLPVTLVDEQYKGPADFVINRTNDYRIAEYYENKGIRVFNPSGLSKIANDKQACYAFMQAHDIPILPVNYPGVPAVKKLINGHGGREVTMIHTPEPFEKNYVYQMPCDTPGKDLRVWVIGKKIITSILRESKTDFRSNYCLGGSAELYRLSDNETSFVHQIINLVESDYIGIDFLFHNGSLVFNEIEDAVGARMVYDKTDIDILTLYCDYIKKELDL